MLKILMYFIQSIFIYLFFLIGFLIRLNLSRKLFAFLFSFLGPIFRSKKILIKNLEIFSARVPNIDKNEIAKGMWKNYGMTFIEYIFLKNLRKNNSHVEIKGEANLIKTLENKKPAIFVSGHFANFELMSMEMTKRNVKLATIYRPLNNLFLNPFMEYLRKKYVCEHQIKKGINGVREAIDFLKKKHSIALMIDQRVSEGEKLNFFGKPALTTTLPAQLSIKYGLEIVPVYIERTKNNKFILEFLQSIKPNNYKNKIELSKKLNIILEQMIIKNASQWIWTHNRWK